MAKPVLDKTKPYTQHGPASRGLRYSQDGNGFDIQENYLGKVTEDFEIAKPGRKGNTKDASAGEAAKSSKGDAESNTNDAGDKPNEGAE